MVKQFPTGSSGSSRSQQSKNSFNSPGKETHLGNTKRDSRQSNYARASRRGQSIPSRSSQVPSNRKSAAKPGKRKTPSIFPISHSRTRTQKTRRNGRNSENAQKKRQPDGNSRESPARPFPVSAKPPQARKRRVKKSTPPKHSRQPAKKQAAPPRKLSHILSLWGIRLLILAFGISAITGTILSLVAPADYQPSAEESTQPLAIQQNQPEKDNLSPTNEIVP